MQAFFRIKKRLVPFAAERIAARLEELIVVDACAILFVIHTALADCRDLIVFLGKVFWTGGEWIGIGSF